MAMIKQLAQAEATADKNRRASDAQWRAAWWATTLALGSIPSTQKSEIGRAQTVVRQVTGGSVSWVSERTVTGRAFIGFEHDEIATLPPRMAVVVARSRVEITNDVLSRLRQAESNGVGLREFSAALTGQAWADTPEGASPEAVLKLVAAQPELVGEAVGLHGQAMDKAMATFTKRSGGHHADATRTRKETPAQRYAALLTSIHGTRGMLRNALNQARPGGFTNQQKEWVVQLLAGLESSIDLLRLAVTGEAEIDWDAELQKLSDLS